MQPKSLEALFNATRRGNTAYEVLDYLEKDGWSLVNPDLEEKEKLAKRWEEQAITNHTTPGECSWCDRNREAWEALNPTL